MQLTLEQCTIRPWQMNDAESQKWSLAQLNDWVYAQIFLTPNQDPWLGLAPPDVFAAIDGNGKGR